jgi:hypothetical protein
MVDNFERIHHEWLSDLIKTTDEMVYRTKDAGVEGRHYFIYNETDNLIEFFIGTTTMLDRIIPKDPMLIRWMKEKTIHEQEEILFERSHYGTMFHILANNYLKNGRIDLDKINIYIAQYAETEKLTERDVEGWDKMLSKHILAFAQFVNDKNVTPLALEHIITHRADDELNLNVAGAIDLVCEMDFGKKRVLAIVDYKSGNIRDSHKYQLLCYQYFWNKKYPDHQVGMIFNFRPKDWSGSPSYELKNQSTEDSMSRKLPHYLRIAEEEISSRPSDATVYSGVVQPGADLSEFYRTLPFDEYLLELFGRQHED